MTLIYHNTVFFWRGGGGLEVLNIKDVLQRKTSIKRKSLFNLHFASFSLTEWKTFLQPTFLADG